MTAKQHRALLLGQIGAVESTVYRLARHPEARDVRHRLIAVYWELQKVGIILRESLQTTDPAENPYTDTAWPWR